MQRKARNSRYSTEADLINTQGKNVSSSCDKGSKTSKMSWLFNVHLIKSVCEKYYLFISKISLCIKGLLSGPCFIIHSVWIELKNSSRFQRDQLTLWYRVRKLWRLTDWVIIFFICSRLSWLSCLLFWPIHVCISVFTKKSQQNYFTWESGFHSQPHYLLIPIAYSRTDLLKKTLYWSRHEAQEI